MSSFEISENEFLKGGKPFRILSGAIHYFRIHPDLWEDRLSKMKLMGLNTLETYVPWNLHEPRKGEFNFTGMADLGRFIDIASDCGLQVIIRPGPYICAEWEFGGLPAWLLADRNMKLRCAHRPFLDAVDRFLDVLIPIIAKRQITKGGPVIAVQVENEYGSYGNDKDYLKHLADGLIGKGIEVPLFTSDGATDEMLQYGTLPGILKTVNFGSRAESQFTKLEEYQNEGPQMCMEFWNGWFDHWGEEHHLRDAEDAAETLDDILKAGGSVNFYMFHGGTNFGFTSGANFTREGRYEPTITSYDYDAPLSECGGITEKFKAFRRVIGKYTDLPEIEWPEPAEKIAPPSFRLSEKTDLFSSLPNLSRPISSPVPLTMEEAGQNDGLILYSTTVSGPRDESPLVLRGLADRAMIYLDGKLEKTMYRNDPDCSVPVTVPPGGLKIDILVENMGRINYGPDLEDRKGISGDILLGQQKLYGWEIYPIPLDNTEKLEFSGAESSAEGSPLFCRGSFSLDKTGDTFISFPGWNKGICWINGFNLGRYWKEGPQKTLYVPSPVLKTGMNEIVVLELHDPGDCEVRFSSVPMLE